MRSKYELLAYIASILISIHLIPEILLIIKNKEAESTSYLTYTLNLISAPFLIIYAYNLKIYPILFSNIFVLISSIIIIFLKYKYS